MAIGPFTPGFMGDELTIREMAELGVIFLMFGVGLHFSLDDLWKVRRIAIPGAFAQTFLTTVIAYALSRFWGWTPVSGLVLGLAVSIASTVVLIRALTDRGLLDSAAGQAAVGWLIVEDIFTVIMLLVLPSFTAGGESFPWKELVTVLAKGIVFAAVMLIFGRRVIPALLMSIAYTRSRELFILVALGLAVGVSLVAAHVFSVSLALGAFIAGVIVKESPLSVQVDSDLTSFREAFSVLFFVSVGMLVDPHYVVEHWQLVLGVTSLIVFGKALITLALGWVLPWPPGTTATVAAGLSQIGEFSFIVGETGLRLGLLDQEQYALILSGAVLSISFNPLMYCALPLLERLLPQRNSFIRVDTVHHRLENHVVVVGYGRVGRHILSVLRSVGVPSLVIESSAIKLDELRTMGARTLFGDASNSDLLEHAGLGHARALVVAVPNETSAEVIIQNARRLNPSLPIIARSATESGLERLSAAGANDVIHPELEGGLEVVRHTLLQLDFPAGEVQQYTDAVRRNLYDPRLKTEAEHRRLHDLINAVHGMEIRWVQLSKKHHAARSIAELDVRAKTGASVVAVFRGESLITNPQADLTLQGGDWIGLIGTTEQLESAASTLSDGRSRRLARTHRPMQGERYGGGVE